MQVDMMHQKATFNYNYSKHHDCQVLGMFYKQYEVAMYVFLPKKRDGLARLENSLTGAQILQLIDCDFSAEVEVGYLVSSTEVGKIRLGVHAQV